MSGSGAGTARTLGTYFLAAGDLHLQLAGHVLGLLLVLLHLLLGLPHLLLEDIQEVAALHLGHDGGGGGGGCMCTVGWPWCDCQLSVLGPPGAWLGRLVPPRTTAIHCHQSYQSQPSVAPSPACTVTTQHASRAPLHAAAVNFVPLPVGPPPQGGLCT